MIWVRKWLFLKKDRIISILLSGIGDARFIPSFQSTKYDTTMSRLLILDTLYLKNNLLELQINLL